jgi:hypothetical protein
MKKALRIFGLGAIVLAGLALRSLDGHIAWNGREIVTAGIALVLIRLAIYL